MARLKPIETRCPERSASVLFSLRVTLLLNLAAIVLVLVALWLSGAGLGNWKGAIAAFLTVMACTSASELVRQRMQFSLRTMVGGLTVLAVLLGTVARWLLVARMQYQAVQTIQALGGTVEYDFGVSVGGWTTTNSGWQVPDWLLRGMYRDFFGNIRCARLSSPGCDDRILRELVRSLPALEELDLVGTSVTDAGIAPLQNLPVLSSLWITPDQITEAGLPQLHGVATLKTLQVWAPRLPAGKPQLPADTMKQLSQLPGLQNLFLVRVRFYGPEFEDFQELPDLRQLVVIDASIPRTAVPHLGLAPPKLQKMCLVRTQLDDFALQELVNQLCRLDQFQELSLVGNTRITDTSVKQLARMRGLKTLMLHGTSITADGWHRLQRALPRCIIGPPGPFM